MSKNQIIPVAASKVGWRPSEFAAAIGLSRATVYELMSAGKLKSVKHNSVRRGARIIVTSPTEYLRSLCGADP